MDYKKEQFSEINSPEARKLRNMVYAHKAGKASDGLKKLGAHLHKEHLPATFIDEDGETLVMMHARMYKQLSGKEASHLPVITTEHKEKESSDIKHSSNEEPVLSQVSEPKKEKHTPKNNDYTRSMADELISQKLEDEIGVEDLPI
jgi:hypothetical protein